jgi:hypothetical protein
MKRKRNNNMLIQCMLSREEVVCFNFFRIKVRPKRVSA